MIIRFCLFKNQEKPYIRNKKVVNEYLHNE